MLKKPTLIKSIVGFVVITALLAIFYYFATQYITANKKSPDSASEELDKTSPFSKYQSDYSPKDKESYSNSLGKFSYKYPKKWVNKEHIFTDWNVVTQKEESVSSSVIQDKVGSFVSMSVGYAIDGGVCDQEKTFKDSYEKLGKKYTILVSNINSRVYEGEIYNSNTHANTYTKIIITPYKDRCYTIYLTDLGGNPNKTIFEAFLDSIVISY